MAAIWLRKESGVAMPVVTIELHNQRAGRDKGINAELAANEVLRLVGKAETVKDGIAKALYLVGLHLLLLGIHRYEHFTARRVSITASQRAIGNVIVAGLGTRGRPAKDLAAYLASVRCLPSCHPLSGTLRRATADNIEQVLFNIELFAALGARLHLSSLALWTWGIAVALQRAIVSIWWHMTSDRFAARDTHNSTYFVAFSTFHAMIIPILTATVNFIGLMAYA